MEMEHGSFIAIYQEDNDIAEIWLRNLEKAKQEHLRTDADAQQIRSRFEMFRRILRGGNSGIHEAWSGLR